MTIECQSCHRPDPATFQIVSRHTTTEGVVVYARCTCGTLHRYVVTNAEMRSWYRADRPAATPTPQPATVAA